ncbi:MAG: redoxin domain-containing protein [Reichenbachiella sp.]
MLPFISMVKAQTPDFQKIEFYDVSKKDFVSINDLMGEIGLVLVFSGSHCPYMNYYEERLNKIKDEYSPLGIEFVLVNSNNSVGEKTETIDQMREKSIKSGYRIISDQSHDVMKSFGAKKNPEVVVLRYKNNQIVKSYKGAIDDNAKSERMVKDHYLRRVLANVSVNKPSPVKDTRPAGCLIK